METKFITQYPDLIFSSQIPDLAISTPEESVYISLVSSDGRVVYKQQLFSHQSEITLSLLSELISNDMRLHGLVIANYTIKCDKTEFVSPLTANLILHVIYSALNIENISAREYIAENFLITRQIRRVKYDLPINLSLIQLGDESESLIINAKYCVAGTPGVNTYSMPAISFDKNDTETLRQYSFSIESIGKSIANKYGARIEDVTIFDVSAICGARVANFYVDPGLNNCESFIFTNQFNVKDVMPYVGVTSGKMEILSSMAYVGEKVVGYDHSVERTFSVESGALTHDEVDDISEALSSREIWKVDYTDRARKEFAMSPILITASTCEHSDSSDEHNTIKFTWRYASRRPLKFIKRDVGIFDDQFNIMFS